MESLQCTAFRFYSIAIRRYKFHIYVNVIQFHFNRDGFKIQSCQSTLLFLTSSENGQFARRIHRTRNEHRFPVEGSGRFNYRSRHVVT